MRTQPRGIMCLVILSLIAYAQNAHAIIIVVPETEIQLPAAELGGWVSVGIGSSGSGSAGWVSTDPVVFRLSQIPLDFDDALSTVTFPDFTLEIEAIDAVASVPVTMTRNVDVTSSISYTPVSATFSATTKTYTLRPDESIFIDFDPAGFSTVRRDDLWVTPIGSLADFGFEQWTIHLVIENQGASGSPILIEQLLLGGASGELTGTDPVSGEQMTINIQGPGSVLNVGQIAVVPEPSTALLLAFGLMALAAGRRRCAEA